MTETATYTYPTTPREQAVADLFCTALEGGIGYWSTCSVYQWSDRTPQMRQVNEFRAVIQDTQDDEGTEYTIDRAVITRGVGLLYQHMRALSQAGTANRYQWQAAKDLHHGNWDELDYDADTADMIIQFGLLGKLVYG